MFTDLTLPSTLISFKLYAEYLTPELKKLFSQREKQVNAIITVFNSNAPVFKRKYVTY